MAQQQHGFVALGVETLGAWAELNQRILQDLTRASLGAIEESARATVEVQHATIAAVRNVHGAYQRAFEQGLAALEETVRDGAATMRDLQHRAETLRAA